LVSAVP
jgi:hypothetical protein